EVERILQRKIDGVDRLRRHGPLFAIDWEAEACDIAVVIKQAAAPDVAEYVVRLDFKSRVVAPGLRVTNPNIKSGELGLGFGFGLRIHPGQRVNMLPKDGNYVRSHRLRICFCFRREVALRVDLADGVAQQAVDQVDAPLPTRTLLRRAGECLAKEAEALVT